ncbi:MAG: hypothetical protein IGS49_26475 [Chlorogloeopsis fritschii C42_A2020_084]|uniref:hypothetical protein n=1 Tax=Chlorogloeopsis fritschii TaxID=1124 RepID=UPI0019F76669|nr:hypothetical protein [Chlorogloeopsis fritschii]MBF2008898.1 hypothetical protein [Chlorogloeopsis fritschii C42_A2020_084]
MKFTNHYLISDRNHLLCDKTKPDIFYRVCLTGIFTRASIKRQLTDIQGELVHDSGNQHPNQSCFSGIEM